MIGYVAQTLITGKIFTVTFPEARGAFRAWVAMQLVGIAITIAGNTYVTMGDEEAD